MASERLHPESTEARYDWERRLLRGELIAAIQDRATFVAIVGIATAFLGTIRYIPQEISDAMIAGGTIGGLMGAFTYSLVRFADKKFDGSWHYSTSTHSGTLYHKEPMTISDLFD